ncbi:hypothetical protein [Desulfococcus multivorans]|jgi:hypothetical protein|uniref:Uncharacterized protein n=1 Tax=Desulfococcus multivorans DSM 2059 TaxID=1121405 RepID=S7TM59_DESML|nr:hypothetical protein [Desulfococcus multivorans]EPR37775.1 hypothetical protein dsmv_2986 [Desulfococcus multivorans DSM 2059]SJZ98094.1 hypothetical protein SAMN02745446_02309 [Desulfococcus multivorans DSM 2059]
MKSHPTRRARLLSPTSRLLEILFKVGFLADKEKGIVLMKAAAADAMNGAFQADQAV